MTSFGVYIVNFEQISHTASNFPLLTLNKKMPAGLLSLLNADDVLTYKKNQF